MATPPDPLPLRFVVSRAKGLHTEQYPAYFRLVVEGPLHEAEAVEAALQALKQSPPPPVNPESKP